MGLKGWVPRNDRVKVRELMSSESAATSRHTFISHLVMKGAPTRVAQELAGHRYIETTMRYAHLAPGAQSNS
jgi:site-specific recombinase XerD